MKDLEGLWSFSTRVYSAPDVAAACLWLQDRHGVDVNLLLFCCWSAARGRSVNATLIAQARRSVASWSREVVQPLRNVRRWLKDNRDPSGTIPVAERNSLREQVKRIELEAEHLEQLVLETLLPKLPATPSARDSALRAMAANTAHYLEDLSIAVGVEIRDQLTIVLAAAADVDLDTARTAVLDGAASGEDAQ